MKMIKISGFTFVRNAVQTALLVVHAASLNPRSKGAHYLVEEQHPSTA